MGYNLIGLKKLLLHKIIPVTIFTLVMFYAYFFSDKTFSWNVIVNNRYNPKMYICLLIAFLVALAMNMVITKRNSKSN